MDMAVLRHRSTSRGGSHAKQNTVAGIRSPNNDSSQMSRSDGVNTTAPLSQNSEVSPRQPPSCQKGRKRRATTELRMPPHGHRVGLEPEGDMQFNYADPNSKHYKYTMQLGIILKREHPGIIEKKEGDVVIKTRPALEWSDYYDDDTLDDKGQIAADRVKQVFWALFKELGKEPPEELRQGASSQAHGATNSSHIGSRALDDNTGDSDSGGNVGGYNSSGNITDLAIGATNLRTKNVSVGGGNTSSNNRESET